MTTLEKRREFTKLRISSHRLHVESGRYNKPKIPYELRKCPFCANSIENELHFVVNCEMYTVVRKELLTTFSNNNFSTLTEDIFMKFMACKFSSNHVKLTNEILSYTNKSIEIRKGHLPENYVQRILAVQVLCAFLVVLSMFPLGFVL